jgi:PAS domain S-box-containing protein
MSQEAIAANILRNMAEGVICLDLHGRIVDFNPAGAAILGLDAAECEGGSFAEVFLGIEGTDAFVQVVLDAIYDASIAHEKVISFPANDEHRR